jgi:hypothetical protein
MNKKELPLMAVLAGLSTVFLGAKASAIEPDSVTFDGTVLTVPFVKVGELAYEVKLVPTADAALEAGDCPVLCLKLASADQSQLNDARDPASFDGVTLSTPRIVVGDEVLSGQFTYLSQYAPEVYFSVAAADAAPCSATLTDRTGPQISWRLDSASARTTLTGGIRLFPLQISTKTIRSTF